MDVEEERVSALLAYKQGHREAGLGRQIVVVDLELPSALDTASPSVE